MKLFGADNWYAVIGMWMGSIGGLFTFAYVYYQACVSAGWVVGIALGWIPAVLAGFLAYFAFFLLWGPAMMAAFVLYQMNK